MWIVWIGSKIFSITKMWILKKEREVSKNKKELGFRKILSMGFDFGIQIKNNDVSDLWWEGHKSRGKQPKAKEKGSKIIVKCK